MEDHQEGTGPHEEETMRYLKEHKVLALFENLTAALVYYRPEDPREFMKDYILQLQEAKSTPDKESPSLIDDSNLDSIFGMLDITKKGHITHEQYLQAMKNLGVTRYNQNPAGAELNKISKDTFMRESKAAVRAATATFLDY